MMDISIFRRSFFIVWSTDKMWFVSSLSKYLIFAIGPYFTLQISSNLINQLSYVFQTKMKEPLNEVFILLTQLSHPNLGR
ncbi:MAG: hypothetical protein K0S80_3769 [Neobacillus sp.]|jgi:hypothetical protein|nr:hypothetical protein [Neobacillus sp.]